jgi:hypothetical protein
MGIRKKSCSVANNGKIMISACSLPRPSPNVGRGAGVRAKAGRIPLQQSKKAMIMTLNNHSRNVILHSVELLACFSRPFTTDGKRRMQ